ncbi:DNA repair protein RAD51 homolog 3-like isoform X2 [Haliotis asinina]|uniref:DNA repair protein RAD51 homolog 3-like isoform X2 n=1 Tax=Haliotis asinina TaxID=109174 RepID=UPI0035320850
MPAPRSLGTFPISPAMKAKLTSAGFLTVSDLQDLKPSELSKELGVSAEAALEVIKTVFQEDPGGSGSRRSSTMKSVTALEMLQVERSLPNIFTFSEKLDDILGGGVPLAKITEFCGAPGIGKTQVCMQLGIDVQIPECFGGLDGETVYVDTEGSFIVERLVDIASATVEHCNNIAQMDGSDDVKEAASNFSLEKLLSGIHYFRCHDYIELLSTVHILPKFLSENKKVKLVIVDSIAFHFRHDFDDMSLRTRLLTSMAQSFIRLATEHKLAVVLTNQMTTKMGGGAAGGSHLIPALGESWGHASTIRVVLYWEGNNRYALLYKSPSKKEAVVPFQITMGGIRDVHSEGTTQSVHETGENPSKRQRVS